MTPPTCYDVIVIGAGPAGATAAYFLGAAGKQVLVLEKGQPPRYKTCGGGLSAGMLQIFPFSFDPVFEAQVQAVTYALGRRKVTLPIEPLGLRMVMRDRFDAHLLAHVQAEVLSGVVVRAVVEADDRVTVVTRDGQTFTGRYLVAADGANSIAARDLGLRRGKRLAGALEVEAEVSPEVMRRFAERPWFIFGEIDRGYLWVFPKARHLSVGIAALDPPPGALQNTLRRVMAGYGIRLEGAPLHGHPIPLYTGREPLATRRSLLVGDAAGLVDPFSGEGIRFAVKSGRLAAEALLADQPERYPRLVQRTIGRNHAAGLFLARVFFRYPRACFALGVRNPFVTFAFAEMLADRTGYWSVVVRMVASLPLYLITEAVAHLAGPRLGDRLRAAVYPAVPE